MSRSSVLLCPVLLSWACGLLAQDPGLVMERGRFQDGLTAAVAVRTVDLDGDGLLDVVRLRPTGMDVLMQTPSGVLRHRPVGAFGLAGGVTLRDLAFGRLDPSGDPLPDIAVLASDGSVDLLVNQGAGGLSRWQPTPIVAVFRAAGHQILAGDVDGDLRDDVIVLMDGLPPALFLARGAGFLDVTVTNMPQTLAIPRGRGVLADFDGDSDLDLVLSSSANLQPLLLANNGLGSFSIRANAMPPGAVPANRILAADIGGSALPDLIFGAGGSAPRAPVVMLNNNGVFGMLAAPGFTPAGVRDMGLADADGDGNADLVVLQGDGSVVYGPGTAGSPFGASVRLLAPAPRAAMTVADLEGDGDADLVLAGAGLEDQILLNGPTGWFDTETIGFPIQRLNAPLPGVVVDFDGNLDPDYLTYQQDGSPVVFRNDGTARFQEVTAPVLPRLPAGTTWRALHALSLASPGRRDLIALGNQNLQVPDPVRVLENRGGAYVDATALRWSSPAVVVAALTPVRASATSALDDVVLGTFGGELVLMRNQGGLLAPAPGFPVGLGLFNLARLLAADLNGDGRQDVIALQDNVPPRVFLALPGHQFIERVGPALTVGQAGDGAVGDVTGDGVPDLVLIPPRPQSGLVLLRGDGTGGFLDGTALLPSLPWQYTGVAIFRPDSGLRIVACRDGEPAHLLSRSAGVFALPVLLPFRGSLHCEGVLPADLDLDGDSDLILHRADSPPLLLLDDRIHLSQVGPAQLGRLMTVRMVSPRPGAYAALLFGNPTGPLPTPYGFLRVGAPALTIWSSFLLPNQREVQLTVPLPPSLSPGRLPLQAGFIDFNTLEVRLSNLELFDLLAN